MMKQLPTTEDDKRRTEYLSICISELRNSNPAFKFGNISFLIEPSKIPLEWYNVSRKKTFDNIISF